MPSQSHQNLRWLLPLIMAVCGMACSTNVQKAFRKKKIIEAGLHPSMIKTEDFTISYSFQADKKIVLKYLGCGGYYMEHAGNAILIDPFFSNTSFSSVAVKKIRTEPKDVKFALDSVREDLFNKVNAVFVAHSHYDHLMDVPYVFNHYLDESKPDLKIHGTESMKAIIGTVIDPVHIGTLENNLADLNNVGTWVKVGDGSIRVLPVYSSHAPHYKIIFPIRLYKGKGKPIKGYATDTTKTCASRWKGGKTLSFLIDFMQEQKVQFRIFFQSSASAPPDGFFPKSLLDRHKVDLAILGAASFDYVNHYPDSLIKRICPDKILISHWEDFFRPYDEYPKRFVRLTNFKEFLLRLDKRYPWRNREGDEMFYFPEPGVKVEVEF